MAMVVGRKLLREYPNQDYTQDFSRDLTGVPEDVGFNNSLSAPRPDFVEGLRWMEFDPFPVHHFLSAAILYKDDINSMVLPHIAGEWKRSGKSMEEAKQQSAYDGAALVYARNQALSFLGKSDPLGHAEVTTFTTDGGTLNFFSHYAAPNEDKVLEYHQFPLASYNMKKYKEFKEGRRHLRNAQDHALQESCNLRDQLKKHWERHRTAMRAGPVSDNL